MVPFYVYIPETIYPHFRGSTLTWTWIYIQECQYILATSRRWNQSIRALNAPPKIFNYIPFCVKVQCFLFT